MSIGKGEIVFVALAASIAAHVATMFFMERQVMTRIASGGARTRVRMAARFDKAVEAPPPAVLREVFAPDAMDGAPASSAAAEMPLPSGGGAPQPAAESAKPPEVSAAMPQPPEIPADQIVFAPPSQTADAFDAFAISPNSGKMPSPQTDRPPVDVIAAGTPAGRDGGAAAPSVAPAPASFPLDDALAASAASAANFAPAAGKRKSEPPPPPKNEVMQEIDEKTVEAEKAAVRDLLDIDDARPLEREVVVSATSASSGGWSYFKLRLSPGEGLRSVPKDVVVLFDASASIANDRLRSCREAAREVLRVCMNTGDRFNLVAFRDDFEYAFRQWRPCDASAYADADKWMEGLAAHGRTDVFGSIASVLKLPRDATRPLVAFVITDGDANSGVSATSRIISRFTALNDGLVSIYMYGVKKTANRELIDILTHGNRGEGYIYEGPRENAGAAIGAMAAAFRDPVVSDMRIIFTAQSRAEAFPVRLKNLYRGQSVEVTGRVPEGVGEVAFSLKGLNGSKACEGFFKVDLSAAKFDPSLPVAWERERRADAALRR